MRIVGGSYRGRTLVAPPAGDQRLRPTSDRLRETIFNILAHGNFDDPVSGARVLDLFAGTGALGFEALSRGAKFVLFMDNSAQSRGLIRQNVDTLGVGGTTRLFKRDAAKPGAANNLGQFDLVFADPPYGKGLAEQALCGLRAGGWLTPGAILVIEETAGAFTPPDGFVECDRRVQGDSEITFLKFDG